MKRAAVLLDRDGTIIVDKNYLNSPDGVEFLPQAIEGLKALSDKGFLLIVVTNQSGVARGLVQESNLDLIHKKMDSILAPHGVKIAKYYYNTAAADSNDPNRKPNPGMLLKAISEFDLDVEKCWMIGDRQADVDAGKNANVSTMFIQNSEHSLQSGVLPTYIVTTLFEASQLIIKTTQT